jgi:ABC-2 type transport system ATP-binding protein
MFLNDWMKVMDLIRFFDDFYSDFDFPKAMEMLQSLGLSSTDRLKTLSKGTKEKVQLIVTMARKAKLYLLDEPIGGVDPAARDYILNTILTNYSENSTVVISTHLISDIERVLDEVIFLKNGELMLHDSVDNIREQEGKSVDQLFREVFAC